jgi:hypothetical protein
MLHADVMVDSSCRVLDALGVEAGEGGRRGDQESLESVVSERIASRDRFGIAALPTCKL